MVSLFVGVSFLLLSTKSRENHNREVKKQNKTHKPTTKPKYNSSSSKESLHNFYVCSKKKKGNFSKLNDLAEDIRIRLKIKMHTVNDLSKKPTLVS